MNPIRLRACLALIPRLKAIDNELAAIYTTLDKLQDEEIEHKGILEPGDNEVPSDDWAAADAAIDRMGEALESIESGLVADAIENLENLKDD